MPNNGSGLCPCTQRGIVYTSKPCYCVHMVSVREFRVHMSKYLKEGCEIGSRGVKIATVTPVKSGVHIEESGVHIDAGVHIKDKERVHNEVERVHNEPRTVNAGVHKPVIITRDWSIKRCKHGAMIGLCKFRCKA